MKDKDLDILSKFAALADSTTFDGERTTAIQKFLDVLNKNNLRLTDIVSGYFNQQANTSQSLITKIQELQEANDAWATAYEELEHKVLCTNLLDPDQIIDNALDSIKNTYRTVYGVTGKTVGEFEVKRCSNHPVWGNACIIDRNKNVRFFIDEKNIYFLENGQDLYTKFPDTKYGTIEHSYSYFKTGEGAIVKNTDGLYLKYEDSDSHGARISKRFQNNANGLKEIFLHFVDLHLKTHDQYKKIDPLLQKHLHF